MSRLIDADALEKKVFERMKQHFSLYERYNICYCNEMTGEIKGQYIEARAVHDLIKKEKTIDAVPVVRCKDCKQRPKKDGYFNNVCPCATTGDPYLDWMPEDDWYCASGEKVER